MTTETVAVQDCPHCQSHNRIYLGDWSDVTQHDPDSFRCWYCGRVSWVEGLDDVVKAMAETDSDGGFGYTVDGRP